MTNKKRFIAVIGGSKCSPQEAELAEEVGRELARQGAILVCGGMGRRLQGSHLTGWFNYRYSPGE